MATSPHLKNPASFYLKHLIVNTDPSLVSSLSMIALIDIPLSAQRTTNLVLSPSRTVSIRFIL